MNKTVEEMRAVKQPSHRIVGLLILFVVAFGLSSVCIAQDYQTRVTQIDHRIFDCKVKIQQLEREKERAVEEVRQGLFCSKCERSKSEIERAERVSFSQHLQNVKGTAIARPGLLAEKASFYDRQIAALQKQIADLEKMKGQLADAARQTADFERQRAAAEQQRQQREREQERLREMKAQQEKLQQERDRIVNKANAKAESYRQAGQAAADGIKQIGDILTQKIERDRLEREQQREQERYDRQMESLDEKIRAQEEQVSRTEKDQSVSSRNGDDGFRLPAPVQLQEPPSEEQIARGQTGIFSPIRNPGEDLLLAGGGKPSDRSMFDVASTQPYQPESRLSDYINLGGETASEPAGNSTERARENLVASGRSLRESASRALDSVAEFTRDEAKPRATAVLDRIFDQATTDGEIDPAVAARDQAKDEVIQGIKTRFYDWFNTKPQPMLNGRSWNELSDDERQDYEIKYDIAKHIWYVFRRSPKEAIEAGNSLGNRLGNNLERFRNVTDDEPDK